MTSQPCTTVVTAAQHALQAVQQQLPGVARRPPVSRMSKSPPDSLMERWALAVAGQAPAAERQPPEAGIRGGSANAGTRGALGEQTAAAPGIGRAPMKRFVKSGLADRWAAAVQAQQRRRQQEEQQRRRQQEEQGRQLAGWPAVPGTAAAGKQATPQKAAPAEPSTSGTAAAGWPARLEKVPAAPAAKVAESPAQTQMDHKSLTAQGIRPLQHAKGESSSKPAAAPVAAAGQGFANGQAGNPQAAEAATPQHAKVESSSKPIAALVAAADGQGFANKQAGNPQAAEAAPTGVQAERFVDPRGRWESTVQHGGVAKGQARAAAQEAAADKPAAPEKGIVAPARTLMDRWGLAVRGTRLLPQEEPSSKPAAGPSAAAEGQGVAGSQAAAWDAPPARPTGVQAEHFVEPGLMGRWRSAMQSREAGQQPNSMSMLVCLLALFSAACLAA